METHFFLKPFQAVLGISISPAPTFNKVCLSWCRAHSLHNYAGHFSWGTVISVDIIATTALPNRIGVVSFSFRILTYLKVGEPSLMLTDIHQVPAVLNSALQEVF